MNKLITPDIQEIGSVLRIVNRDWRIASRLADISPDVYQYFIVPADANDKVKQEPKATPNYTNAEQLRRYAKAIDRARDFNNRPPAKEDKLND